MAAAIRLAPPPPPVDVQLTLSEAEASTLAMVLLNIGGVCTPGRGHVTAISEALRSAGVRKAPRTLQPCNSPRGSLYFTNEVNE